MITVLRFDVVGTPAPQGSKKGFVNKASGRVIMTESSAKVRPWRQDVASAAAAAATAGEWQVPSAVAVQITFWFRRPKSHYRTGRNAHLLKPDAPVYVATRPDVDKLQRSTFDALTTAGVIGDDCRIVEVLAVKRYADADQATGANIALEPLDTSTSHARPTLEGVPA